MGKEWAKALLATVLIVVLAWGALSVAAWRNEATPQEGMEDITRLLFGPYVVPFEVLSVLLLGALIGSLYLGAKVRREEGSP